MWKSTLLLAGLMAMVAACSSSDGPYRAPGQKACDDGGSGGVLIDGICL